MPRAHRPLLRVAALTAALVTHASHAASPLALPPGTGLCAAVQAHLQAGRLAELESDAVRDVRIGGRRANVRMRTEGTGLAPFAEITDASTGEAFDPGLGELHGEPRGDGSIVTWRGRHHVLLMGREQAGGYTVALDGGPSCEIDHERTEQVAPDSVEPRVCLSLLQGDGPAQADFTRTAMLSDDDLAVRWHGDVGPVAATGTARLDIANDGRPVDVVQLTTPLRQPDACIARLWDVLGAQGTRLADDGERRALAARGIVASDPAAGADCYSEMHFLLDGRRVLLETLEHAQSDEANPTVRHVEVVEHGQLRGVCETTSTDQWRVTPGAPAPAVH